MTERKRDVRFALMDAAFAADRKFVRLSRRAVTPIEYAAAVGVFWLVLADARRSKSPDVNFGEYEEYGDQLTLLQECRLLTETGFDPATFDRWAPAYRSPWDEKRVRKGTPGYGSQHTGTVTSSHVNSSQVPNGGEGVGEGEPLPETFMGFKHRLRPNLADIQRQHEESFKKTAEVAARLRSEKEGPE